MRIKPSVYVFFLILTSFIEKSIAQDTIVSSGIFLTAKDFQKNILMEEADCGNGSEKFKTNDFFSRGSFGVINKGRKITYKKSNIYAYRNCDNKVWRFYDNEEYQILESKGIYIYDIRRIVFNAGAIEKDRIYYFSIGPNGDIKELSMEFKACISQ